MSASASAPSSPGYHAMSTAPARVAQGISTGEPTLTTTTVRAVDLEHRLDEVPLAARQGEVGAVVTLGLPLAVGTDDDQATSASAAAATARSNSSPVSGGDAPMRAPMMGDDDERGQTSTASS